MEVQKHSLPFLLSLVVHCLAVAGLFWIGLRHHQAVSVTPGISSLRMITVQASRSTPTPPPPPTPKPREAEVPSTPRRIEKNETRSSPQNGALTPSQPDTERNAPPLYPEAARQRGIEGTAFLLVRVGRDGGAKEVSVSRSSGSLLLDEAALAAVRRWRFRPASLGALPVESLVEVPIRFRLDR